MKITDRSHLDKYRKEFLSHIDTQKKKIYVCGGTGCVAGGSMDIYEEIKKLVEEAGLNCEVSLDSDACQSSIGLKKSGCHGFCEMGPVLRIEPSKLFYLKVTVDDCKEIVEKSIVGDDVVERLIYHRDGIQYPEQEEIPFYKHQTRIVLEDCGQIDAESIKEYIAYGGYTSLEKVMFEQTPDETIKIITD